MTRIGKVTQVYPAERMVRVLFEDMQTTSEKLPILSVKDYIPDVGKYVMVQYTGNKDGVVVGEYFYSDNPPDETTKSAVRYGLGETADKKKSYIRCDNGTIEIHCVNDIILSRNSDGKSITLGDLITKLGLEED